MTHDPTKLADELLNLEVSHHWTDEIGDGRRAYVITDDLRNELLSALHSPTPPPDVAKLTLGKAICWLRLLATRFRDEWPNTAIAADSHAEELEHILDALASQDAPSVAGGMVERYRAAGRREGREAAAVEPGESEDAPSAPPSDDVERARKRIVSYLFEACQPDRGDVFSWCDDHAEEIAIAALQETKP